MIELLKKVIDSGYGSWATSISPDTTGQNTWFFHREEVQIWIGYFGIVHKDGCLHTGLQFDQVEGLFSLLTVERLSHTGQSHLEPTFLPMRFETRDTKLDLVFPIEIYSTLLSVIHDLIFERTGSPPRLGFGT